MQGDYMDSYSILLVLLGLHTAFVFYITILIVECPFRSSGSKFLFFLFSLFVPLIGALFTKHKLSFISLKSKASASAVSSAYSPDYSGDSCSGDSGGGCD